MLFWECAKNIMRGIGSLWSANAHFYFDVSPSPPQDAFDTSPHNNWANFRCLKVDIVMSNQ